MNPFNLITESIAIDLGTANTLISHRGQIVVDQPSIIARNARTGKIIAIGTEANLMQGKTNSNVETIRPLKDGVIADFYASEEMIKRFIKTIPFFKKKWVNPPLRMVICIPSGVTEVEKKAVLDSARNMNARDVYLIHEPVAAAIGTGIDIKEASGNMIVDIGGGTTEIAVMSMSGIVCDKSIKVAGDLFNYDIVSYLRTHHNLYIGEVSAEDIKIRVGAAFVDLEGDIPEKISVRGRDLLSGKPRELELSHSHVVEALEKSIISIENAVMDVLSGTPPELSSDLYRKGIYLAGGGALLRGLAKRISLKTELPIHISEDPLRAVVRGTALVLKNLEEYKSVLIN